MDIPCPNWKNKIIFTELIQFAGKTVYYEKGRNHRKKMLSDDSHLLLCAGGAYFGFQSSYDFAASSYIFLKYCLNLSGFTITASFPKLKK